MPYDCKEKQAAYAKNHYDCNKETYKSRTRERNARARPILKEIVDVIKSQPCTDCGECYPPYVMDFDHVRGQKAKDVARMVGGNYSVKRVLAEIAKCELVCSNCHRERTHQRRVAAQESDDG